jgi:drug/metabolite transporter (DMT)-like permease
LLFFRYAIAVLLVGAYVSLRSEWHWPDQRSLLIGFLEHFLWLIAVLKALEFGISAGSVALIAAMQPVLTALIAPYLLAECNHFYQWLGVVVSILSFFLMLHLIRTRNAARVSSLQYFVPPVTMLIALRVFSEAPSLLGFVGRFITASGFFLIHRGEQALVQQNG